MSTDVQIPGAKGILVDTTGAEIIAEDSPAVSTWTQATYWEVVD